MKPRALLLAPALAGLVGTSLLAAACGGSSSPGVAAVAATTSAATTSTVPAQTSPAFPDPSSSDQHIPPSINTDSPQFQAVETTCEKQARQAVGLP